MPVSRSMRRFRHVGATVAACSAIVVLAGCAPEPGTASELRVTSAPVSAAPESTGPSTDPIDHATPEDPMETGAGLAVVSLAEADTAGTHEATTWHPGDALPSYLQQALRREGLADPASLVRIVATHGVEAWIGSGAGDYAGRVCIVSAQSQIPVADTLCVQPADFEAKGAGFVLKLPSGTQAIEAYALPERAKGTGIAPGAWTAPSDRVLLRAKASTVDEPPLSVPTVDGSAPILVARMG